MTAHQVSLSQRYASAWQEISQRIQARQNANVALFTVSFGLVPLFISKLIESETPKEVVSPTTFYYFITIAILIPSASWAFSFWIIHNDKTIGLLGVFCATLEKIDNPNNDLLLPAWHDSRQHLIGMALDERRWSDYASCIALIISATPSGAVTIIYFPTHPIFSACTLAASLCVIYPVLNVRDLTKFRASLHEIKFELRGNQAGFYWPDDKKSKYAAKQESQQD